MKRAWISCNNLNHDTIYWTKHNALNGNSLSAKLYMGVSFSLNTEKKNDLIKESQGNEGRKEKLPIYIKCST